MASALSSSEHKAQQIDECQVTPVIHVLQYPGCVPKPIPSFACTGRCSSYIQPFKFGIYSCILKLLLSVRLEDLADGEIVHVLSGEWRARGQCCLVLSESQAWRKKVQKGMKVNLCIKRNVCACLQVTTKAPLECMCRPCTSVEESAIIPQEIAAYADEGPLNNHFLKPQ
uniref:DAN domain-containing protein n=1 Tax=Rhodnius prolixus TaxID=13249 RepID=T1H9U3_RHOPR